MTAFRDPFPLSNHRASLARYLRGIVVPGRCVAGAIIAQRLPARYARDPVRPSLVLWACDAADGDLADALPVGAAFDLFDRFLLLHDELTDESAATVASWGLGQSLNAGDAFYALAFRSLASDVGNAPRRLETARLVGQAVLEAIERSGDEVARNASLTAAAMQAGVVVAGGPERIARAFAQAGRLLGKDPTAAVAAVRQCVSGNDLAAFEEVARYVARRVA